MDAILRLLCCAQQRQNDMNRLNETSSFPHEAMFIGRLTKFSIRVGAWLSLD
jgi:hypothetical protein